MPTIVASVPLFGFAAASIISSSDFAISGPKTLPSCAGDLSAAPLPAPKNSPAIATAIRSSGPIEKIV